MKKMFSGFVYFLGIISLIGIIGPALKENFQTLATILFWFLCIVGAKAIIFKNKDK